MTTKALNLDQRVSKKVLSDLGVWEETTYYIRDAQGNVMAVYKHTQPGGTPELRLEEMHIYGASRLGMTSIRNNEMITAANPTDDGVFTRTIGETRYELSNHLGNVLSVITDIKIARATGANLDYYEAQVISYTDYYPFGSPMDNANNAVADRNWSGGYRYGYNYQEEITELSGPGMHYTALYWEYDSRIVHRWNIDPKYTRFPYQSTYAVNLNNPIIFEDRFGDCPPCFILLGLVLFPSIAVAPTGDPVADGIAINNARDMQTKWLAVTIIGGGAMTSKSIMEILGQQFAINYTAKSVEKMAEKGTDVNYEDLEEVFVESFQSLDIADALIEKLPIGKIQQAIAASMVDLTPAEAQALGLGKTGGEFTFDAVANALGEAIKPDFASGKYGDVLEKLYNTMTTATQDVIEKTFTKEEIQQIQDAVQNNLIREVDPSEYVQQPDALRVNMPQPRIVIPTEQK